MPVQTTYSLDHGEAYAGMVADQQLCNKVSKLNKSGASIPFGFGVVRDGDNAAGLAGGAFTADAIVGVVARELNRAYEDGETFGAKDGYQMSVITTGVVWVNTVDAATAGGNVFLDQDGTIRATAGATGIQIPNAKFVTSAGAGALAKISLNIGG